MPLDVNTFAEKIKAKYPAYKDVDNQTLAEKIVEKYPTYKSQVDLTPVKKKEVTESATEDGSLDTPQVETQKPSESLDLGNGEFTGYPGKEKNKYKLVDNEWHDFDPETNEPRKIKSEGRINALNKYFKQDAYLSQSDKMVKEAEARLSKILGDDKTDVDVSKSASSKPEYLQIAEAAKSGDKEALAKALANKKTNDIVRKKKEIDAEKMDIFNDASIFASFVPFENEEDYAEEMNYRLNEFGFYFEETGFGDRVIAKYSPDGGFTFTNEAEFTPENISKDKLLTFLNSKLSKSETEALTVSGGKTDEERKKNYYETIKVRMELMSEHPDRYGKDLISEGDAAKVINREANILQYKNKKLSEEYDELSKYVEAYNQSPTPEGRLYIKNKATELGLKEISIAKDYEKLNSLEKNFNKALSVYKQTDEEKGTFLGNLGANFVSGATNLERMITEKSIDLLPYVEDLISGDMDFSDNDKKSKQLKRDILPNIEEGLLNIGSLGTTTKEYQQSDERGVIETTLGFLSESIGTAISAGGNPLLLKAGFFAQSYNSIKKEMRGDEFDGLTEAQKELVAVPYAMTIGALEKLGFKMSTSLAKKGVSNAVINGIIRKTFTSLPKGTSREIIEATIQKNILAAVTDKALKITSGGVIEGVTEGLQEYADVGTKNLANYLSGHEYFKDVPLLNTPEGFMKASEMALESFGYGMLGGNFMTAGSMAKEGVKSSILEAGLNRSFKKDYENIMDEGYRASEKEAINISLRNGEISEKEAEEQKKEIDEKYVVYSQLSDDLFKKNVNKARKAAELIKEKGDITSEIEGKDKALVTAKTDRINAINEELAILGQDETTDTTTDGDVQPGVEPSDTKGQGTDVQETVEPTGSEEQVEEIAEVVNRNTDLFPETSEFADVIGGSGRVSNISNYREVNGIGISEYTNPENGLVDVIMSGTSDSDYVGYVRIYENGKPTNRWTSKMENASNNKTNFKTMLSEVQKLLPENHEYTEKTSISTDGLRIYGQQLNRGYEYALDENGNRLTNRVAINGDSRQNVLGINVNIGGFDNISVTNNNDFDKVKKALIPLISSLGLNESNIHWENGTVEIDLPVLRNTSKSNATEDVESEETSVKEVKQYKGQKALDWLDNFESKLDDITDPKNFNDATRVIPAMALKGIVKALKASIKAGMTINKAIDKYFSENTEYTKEQFEEAMSIPSKVKSVITQSAKDEKKAFKEGKKEGKVTAEEKLKPVIAKLKELKKDQTAAKKYILEQIKEFEGKKVLNAKAVLNRLMRVNLNNPVAVDNFIEYAEKAFKNAAYIDRVNAIIKMNKSSKQKSKKQQNAVKEMAKRLASIDPVMVEDLDKLEAISLEVRGATKNGFKEPADISKVNEYIDKVEAEIKEKMRLNLLGEFSELVNDGIINKNSTLEEIMEVIDNLESNENVDGKSIEEKKAELKDKFESQKIAAQMAIRESKTDLAKSKVKEALDIDIDKLSISDAYKLVTALDNFIVNDIADGLGPIVNKSIGIKNAEKFARLKYIAPSFNAITRTFADVYSSIPLLADTMFGNVKKGTAFLRTAGFNAMQRMSVTARMNAKRINDNYVSKFYKTMPNGEKFFSVNNIFERGVIADMLRTNGDPGDFKRKKDLLFQSADALLKGNKEEVKKGTAYKEVFEKIGLEQAENIDDLKVDPINTSAVKFWIKEWSKIYSDLKELNSVVYNTSLENDIDYTTKRMSTLSYKDKRLTEADIKEASSLALDLGIVSAQAGTLKEVTRPKAIKDRYVDLDFDMSQSKSMLASQLDLHTTDISQQIKAFLDSEDFNKSFEKPADAAMVRSRMSDYVNMTRMKKGFSSKKENKMIMDSLGTLSKVATRWTLGGIAAIPKQTIPVFTNTFINTITSPDLFFKGFINPLMGKSSMNEWIENNDLPITIRGLESRTVIERSDNLLKDSKAKSKFKKAGESIDKIWLEKFLGNSDVYAARSSFMTYYLQSLRNQGLTTNVNWDNHTPNEKAVEYAQHMVDRQQNISDIAAAGKLFSSDNGAVKFIRQAFFPFSSFLTNSKAKLFADVRSLSVQDRKELAQIIKSGKVPQEIGAPLLSIIATLAEISMFQVIGVYLRDLYKETYNSLTGNEEEEEEDKEKREKWNTERFLKQTFADVVSPAPAVDFLVLNTINSLYESVSKSTFNEDNPEYKELLEEEMKKYESETKEVKKFREEEFKKKYQDEEMFDLSNTWEASDLDKFGTFAIPAQVGLDIIEGVKELNNGYYEKEFMGTASKKYFTEEQKDMNKEIFAGKLITRFLLPDQSLRNIVNIYDRENKKNALNSNQYQEYIKLDKKASDDEVALIKKGYDSVDIKDYIRVDVKGLNDKQKDTYFEVMRKGKKSDVYTDDLILYVKKGYSAKKILEKLEE